MGRKAKRGPAPAAAGSDDALLEAAIAESRQAKQDALEEEARMAAIAEEVRARKAEEARGRRSLAIVPHFSCTLISGQGVQDGVRGFKMRFIWARVLGLFLKLLFRGFG